MRQLLYLAALISTIWARGQNIDKAEYFLNTDPGAGKGTALAVHANSGDLEQTFIIAITGLNKGFHSFYVRTHQADGNWGHYDQKNFFIGSFVFSSKIASAEYFFDSDPGAGNASALSVKTNPGELTQTYAIATNDLAEGFHNLYIRTKDTNGGWSHYDRKNFYIGSFIPGMKITSAEYFFDADPGAGSGTVISLTDNNGTLAQTFTIPTTGLDRGFHSLYLRTKDDTGGWSLYDRQLFYISNPIENQDITAAEYFIDSDPGVGNGMAVTFSTITSLQSFNAPLSSLDLVNGEHFFYVRVKNSTGDWSIYDTQAFTVDNTLGLADVILKKVSIFPNPFTTLLHIKTGDQHIVGIKIYDNLGRTVFATAKNQKSYDLSTLSSGPYILNITIDKGAASYKIIKK